MASLIPGFEYDVFISYRQKDNKGDHWVTEFVNALRTELDATFKEDISIYFDENPHDGLQEHHDVDESLKEKLKCLIFIPILSRTYCDPRSFAFEHEFKPFVELASKDAFGLKVKLPGGNVTSRVLPVRIHDLDKEDIEEFERVTGGILRSIDFVYQAAGVNRPLRANEEQANENQNHTLYRNQVNKISNAIRDIIHGMKTGVGKTTIIPYQTKENIHREGPSNSKRKFLLTASLILLVLFLTAIFGYNYWSARNEEAEKSIAVLPFKNLSNDPEQEYFVQGITEDILTHLAAIADLKVKASYASFNYKESHKPISEIGEELAVANILTGSIQRDEKKVRITTRLVNTEANEQLWSQSYDRELDDILKVQSEIALEIAEVLKARLSGKEIKTIKSNVTNNVEAYEYYLKARSRLITFSLLDDRDKEAVMGLLSKAMELDSNLSDAYALKGWAWNNFRFGKPEKIWKDSAVYFAEKSIQLNPNNPSGYMLRHYLKRYERTYDDDLSDLEKAYELSPNNTDILNALGWSLLKSENEEGADLLLKFGHQKFMLYDYDYYAFWGTMYEGMHDYKKAEEYYLKASKIKPEGFYNLSVINLVKGNAYQAIRYAKIYHQSGVDKIGSLDALGEYYCHAGYYDSAINSFQELQKIEATFTDPSQYLPTRHRIGYCYWMKGNKAEAMEFFKEQLRLDSSRLSGRIGMGSWMDITATYYDLGITHAFLNHEQEAMKCFEQVLKRGEFWPYYLIKRGDPMLNEFRSNPRFVEFMTKFERHVQFKVNAIKEAVNRYEASAQLNKHTSN